ncbi:MAG: galactosyldiacylglycerol synthase [Thermoanaerobaculia bacterium]|nr:galactosyldiacylglycerol synthase [Thermoanaerobaculia bacterium]
MPRLYVKDTNALLGEISNDDLAFLIEDLEEEDEADTDYYIDAATLEFLEEEGAPKALLELLKKAVGDGDGVDVRWEA